MEVIAHRGSSQIAPENTMASFSKAKDEGILWFECDIQLSLDNQLFVLHDYSLDRTTSAKGRLDLSFSKKINSLDAGSWFSNDYANEKIPTLIDILEFIKRYNLHVNLELKASFITSRRFVRKFKAVMELYPSLWGNVIVSSFSMKTLYLLRKILPNIKFAHIAEKYLHRFDKDYKNLKCYSIHLDYFQVTKEDVDRLHDLGYLVYLWTVNERSELEKCLEYKVDGIFSDCPAKIKAFLDQ